MCLGILLIIRMKMGMWMSIDSCVCVCDKMLLGIRICSINAARASLGAFALTVLPIPSQHPHCIGPHHTPVHARGVVMSLNMSRGPCSSLWMRAAVGIMRPSSGELMRQARPLRSRRLPLKHTRQHLEHHRRCCATESWRDESSEGDGPTLRDFMRSVRSADAAGSGVHNHIDGEHRNVCNGNESAKTNRVSIPVSHTAESDCQGMVTSDAVLQSKSFFIETMGCQMNVSDSEIVRAVLLEAGLILVDNVETADVILINTCSIREGAEQRVWDRLNYFRSIKRRSDRKRNPPLVGVLGCMAERLKEKILESDKMVDLVAGPDAYRDLPRLLFNIQSTSQTAINVLLSQDETYADIMPVRHVTNQSDPRANLSAFVSIMRGCDNMCSYCIVPFTRGRERSRSAKSIVHEVQLLSEQGYKEVTLLGQNVNSYNFIDRSAVQGGKVPLADNKAAKSPGFYNISRRREHSSSVSFTRLLDMVTSVDPEMRVRFTSPHPKDFPDDLLHLMRERHNLCKQIHLPIQSGATENLARMRRGYSREAYLQLVERVRSVVPTVSLSTDIIAGFCGETEEEHELTLSAMHSVKYDQAFMFKYSQRERTHAHRRMTDNVPEAVKSRRLREIIDTFHDVATVKVQSQVGQIQLVLVEGRSRKSDKDLAGRNDGNKKVVFPKRAVPSVGREDISNRIPAIGEYVVVRIMEATSGHLKADPIEITSLRQFHALPDM